MEQSATYWQYFQNLLADVKIEKVGDFRDYTELANRRIGNIYGFIATIGVH